MRIVKKTIVAMAMALVAWGATAHAADLVIGISFDALENDIWKSIATTFQSDATDLGKRLGRGVQVRIVVADGDVGRQNAQSLDLIGLHPDVIFFAPKDSKAIVSSIRAAEAAGIPAITYMRDSASDAAVRPTTFLGLDAMQQGYSTAKALFATMKKDGVAARVINVMGDLGDENAVLRSKGLKLAAQEDGATILQDVPTGWNPDRALSGLAAALQIHPDATAVFVASDHLIQGVKTAMERADHWAPQGDKRHIYLGSQDVFPVAIAMIRDGYIDADTVYDVGQITKKAMDVVAAIVAGQHVDPTYMVPGRVATRENIDSLPDLWSRALVKQ